MLEYVWFVALLVVSLWFAWKYDRVDRENVDNSFDAGQWLILSFGAATMSFAVSWKHTGKLLFDYLSVVLPQAGTQIAVLTAYALTGAACLIIVFGVPFSCLAVLDRLAERKPLTQVRN